MTRMRRRSLAAHTRYLWALASRFKITLVMTVVLFALVPLLFRALYVTPGGGHITFGRALHHVYFLLFGQPSLEYIDNWAVEVATLLIPPLGIATVVDGVVRFAFLYFAKHREDKEWIAVISSTLKGHVIVVGAGRVGFRVATLLLDLQHDVVVIDRNPQAQFLAALKDLGVPVLVEDVKTQEGLARVNVRGASAIVCATDDDLANLNLSFDARKANPDIRVVIRVFDDDLVERVRDNFRAEALSTSAIAAPAYALAALDPRVVHSFRVGPHLMVVSEFQVGQGLAGLTIADVRDRHGGLVLALRRAGPAAAEQLHPEGKLQLGSGDAVTVQARYDHYRALRELTGEAAPPLSSGR